MRKQKVDLFLHIQAHKSAAFPPHTSIACTFCHASAQTMQTAGAKGVKNLFSLIGRLHGALRGRIFLPKRDQSRASIRFFLRQLSRAFFRTGGQQLVIATPLSSLFRVKLQVKTRRSSTINDSLRTGRLCLLST